ncbi:dihydrofolate reductase family protein [Paraclostridium sordellii]|uniref:dihydrofolate reductase family protein n=1 Tax=Paraclostridium sordellii TaxID=1505 RepID=UPI0005E4D513|nr:dihydrofolate reductase family protein [Paeniclostridium sordellii]CEP79888.1 riboflavin biosynthesis protein RibD C-domain-containing protein [[Clostridium] sordellii] [Paeniclostridium sordellii]
MSRKIILNLAMSIDGYIASEDGGFDWIVGDGDDKLDTKNKWDFNEFLKNIDVVVMGKKCYDQNFHKDFKDKKVYVDTSCSLENHDNIHFINNDIVKTIEAERKNEGKDIFLFGGGVLIDSFLKADVIDEYIIGIIPTVLGKGRPLFLGNNPKIDLHLDEYFTESGIVILRYSKR